MSSFDNMFAQLQRNSQASTSFLLVKSVDGSAIARDALMIFDKISEYPPDVALEPSSRSTLVTERLNEALTFIARSNAK